MKLNKLNAAKQREAEMINAVRGAAQDYSIGKDRNYAHMNGKKENKLFG